MFSSFTDADTLRDPFGPFSPFYPTALMRETVARWPHGATEAFAEIHKLQLDLYRTVLTLWLLPLSTVHDAPDPEPAAVASAAPPVPVEEPALTDPLPAESLPADPLQADPLPSAATTVAAALPILLPRPEGDPDDLQRISGIGPKLQQTLNGLGIWHFHQIAALAPAEAAWLNDRIGFKGRIEREGWQAQASRLAKASRPPQAA
jgi:NADH-quinone oxidoreductase subunit E